MTALLPERGNGVRRTTAAPLDTPTHTLYLPRIHCAGCIRAVERVLADQPGIRSARVNLSQRRAAIAATPGADPSPWIDALARAGYDAYEVADSAAPPDGTDDLILRLGVAGFAMMNVMLLSVAIWSGATEATRDLFHWISAAIALPATVFSARPFFVNALSALRVRRVNMDVPISLAILLACGLSLYETMEGGDHAYFDAALSLTFFLLAGRVLDHRMRRAARSAARDLAALEPARVQRLEGDTRVSVKVNDLAVGDTIWLAAGGRVPVEATLLAEAARVDRGAITGESDPVTLPYGAALRAGDILLTGPVTARATAVGENTTLRRMAALAAVAEGARTAYTSLADRAARAYVPLVHGLAAAAFAGWWMRSGDLRHAIGVAIATLIITCPCALGLAVPAVATAATGRLFRRGLLVKSETALERLAQVDTVVFDKTGTLTRSVLDYPATMPDGAKAVLRALADVSDHPLSRSLRETLADVEPAPLSSVEEHAGLGLSALWNGRLVRLGSGEWIGCDTGTALAIGPAVYPLERREALLPDAREAVAGLRALGLSVHVLTGDRAEKAAAVAADLAPDETHAGIDPEGKQRIVAGLQAQGRKVLMVGDGLNDTVALTEAWASIAPGTALEASRSAADVVLLGRTLRPLAEVVRISRSARRRILENFGLAAAYNAIAIPLAVAGYASPLMAALAMSLSSITVTLNALRVR